MRCLIALALLSSAAAADPVLIDLAPLANLAWEDDAIPGNGQGGWSDEGVNDMFTWPAMPAGRLTQPIPCALLDPAAHGGKAVLALRGRKGMPGLPESVEVKLATPVQARWIHLVANSSNGVGNVPPASPVGTLTVRHADGSSQDIVLRDGEEVLPWWSAGNDKVHTPPARVIVHRGQNLVSKRWKIQVGICASRLEHATPAVPITALALRSTGLAQLNVFAITLSDVELPAPAGPPPVAKELPAERFAAKTRDAARGLLASMRTAGFLEGIRATEVVRGDLLAITVDNALTQDNGADTETAKACAVPERWTVQSDTDPAFKQPQRPSQVGFRNFERYNGSIAAIPADYLWWQTYFLRLPQPLKSGHRYRIAVDGMAEGIPGSATLAYDENSTPAASLKINQVGYAGASRQRFAYLGYWAGTLGAVDFADLAAFKVVDAAGATVHEGRIAQRARDDVPSGEHVFELDLAALQPGTFRLVVPGLGCSPPLRVGKDATAAAAFDCFRAFFHQRCGQEFKQPWTETVKPACHVECWESGHLVGNPHYVPKPGEAKRSFTGGYHDAADYDHFAYHLGATASSLAVYEARPQVFGDGQFRLPESGNRIPDLLDEAAWALRFFLEHQREDGAVPLGRGNDQDAWEQNTDGKRAPFGVLPPTPASTPAFAAVAAQFSVLLRPFDAAAADRHLQAAERAFAYANQRKIETYPIHKDKSGAVVPNTVDWSHLIWAAAELHRATGKPPYAAVAAELWADPGKRPATWNCDYENMVWAILRGPGCLDAKATAEFRAAYLKRADETCARTAASAYRLGTGPYLQTTAWGGATPGRFGDILVRAHILTGEQRYLDAVACNADFLFGANPMGKGFVTGMGVRGPVRPEISRFHYRSYKAAHPDEDPLANGGPPVLSSTLTPGITVYGLGPPLWYFPKPPNMHSHRDIWGDGAEPWSEFTIPQTIGPTAITTLYLMAMDAASSR